MLPEFGAPELLVIAAIALIVVGPKDLPILMRRVGQFVARMRSMAMEFRASFDELARQSEIDELRKEVEAMRAAAHEPVAAATEAVGLQDIHTQIHDAISGAVSLPAAELTATPEPAPVAAEEAPKPKRRRVRKTPAKSEAPEPPEAQP